MVRQEQIDHLKVGGLYLFDHKVKGPFNAKFVGLYEQLEDEADPYMLVVEIATGPGTGQARLANSVEYYSSGGKGAAALTMKMLRPSLINDIMSINSAEKERLMEAYTKSANASVREDVSQFFEQAIEPEEPVKKKRRWFGLRGGE